MPTETDRPHMRNELGGTHHDQLQLPSYSAVSAVITRHPALSMAAGFSVGFGLGVLITAVLSGGHERSWMERHHIPEHLHDLTSRLRHIPEQISRRMS